MFEESLVKNCYDLHKRTKRKAKVSDRVFPRTTTQLFRYSNRIKAKIKFTLYPIMANLSHQYGFR